jgi:hypothetical protein
VSRRALRTRVLEVPRHLGCGCSGQPGDTVYQDGRGRPWLCATHCRAKVRDYPPQRGAATVAQVLAAEARAAEAETQTTHPGQAGATPRKGATPVGKV